MTNDELLARVRVLYSDARTIAKACEALARELTLGGGIDGAEAKVRRIEQRLTGAALRIGIQHERDELQRLARLTKYKKPKPRPPGA